MNNQYTNAAYLTEANKCKADWAKTGLLEGLGGEDLNMASVLLENQKLWNEQVTDTGDVAQFKRISIPLVRRIYPHLIANKIVSVQPLLGPTGLVYYMRFRYSSNKGSTRGNTQGGFPSDDALSLQQLASGEPNLDIWYANQYVNQETQTNPGGGTSLSYTLEKTPVLAGTLSGKIYDGNTLVYNFVVSSAGAFTFTAVGSPNPTVTAGSVNLVTGVVTLTWSADPGTNSVIFNYEYNMEGNADLPEINMAVESESITATTRKLKASWTWEAQQDLRAQHSIDAQQELTSILAQEINLEIDREVITDLRNNAGTVATWDFNTTLGETVKEKYESLYVKLVEIGNLIHKKTLRGAANWIVCSPEVAAIFESATAGFAPTMSDSFTVSAGIQYVGAVNQKWQIYKDPLFPTTSILMGYKGSTPLDSGYYYCPYVPLTQSPVVYHPDDFTPRVMLMTRYGKKLLNNGARYYARINLQNFVV